MSLSDENQLIGPEQGQQLFGLMAGHQSTLTSGSRAIDPQNWVYRRVAKRLMDVFGAIILLPAVVLIILVLCIMIMRDGSSPVYGHTRVGRHGRVFKCWKLRSMVPNSQAHLQRHLAADANARQEWFSTHKLTSDPRITPLGQILRRTSLDELPQIWNVLRGEMSFIGPRPVTRSELRKYGDATAHYLAMQPGITGLWQVSGRNALSYDQRVKLDVEYAANCGFLMDVRILLRTIPVVLRRTGR